MQGTKENVLVSTQGRQWSQNRVPNHRKIFVGIIKTCWSMTGFLACASIPVRTCSVFQRMPKSLFWAALHITISHCIIFLVSGRCTLSTHHTNIFGSCLTWARQFRVSNSAAEFLKPFGAYMASLRGVHIPLPYQASILYRKTETHSRTTVLSSNNDQKKKKISISHKALNSGFEIQAGPARVRKPF